VGSSGPSDRSTGLVAIPWTGVRVDPALDPLVCVGVLGRPGSLTDLRHRLESWVATTDLPASAADDLVLAGYEALVNAAEHAYPSGSGPVDLLAACTMDGRVLVTVRDYGRWRPPPLDPDFRGRGLLMIRALSRQAEVRQGSHGTTVHMQWRLPAGGRGSGTAQHQ
jgi:serine/threonine-protein kinase RsbW